MSSTRITHRSSFSQPLTSGIALGILLTGGLYALMLTGSLNDPVLWRFCFSHWTASVSLLLFFIAISFLANKFRIALAQLRLTDASVDALGRLIHDGHSILPPERPRWLEASSLSLPEAWQTSWFGMRLNRTLTLQVKRGRRESLEQDLQTLAKADARRHHDSYNLVRTILWALPILGALGSTIVFSESAQLQYQVKSANTQLASHPSLASIDGTPSTSLVALDTTILALGLTLLMVFAKFIVVRTEQDLLERMDQGAQDTLIEFLAADSHGAEEGLLSPVRQMTADLVTTIHQVVEQQANIWSRSISESQRQWSNWTQVASECIASNLTDTISAALKNHASRLEKIQEEGSRQIDTRWQQWQTTLSDQARAMSSQQKELIRQTDSIQQLVSATTDLRKLEDAILESVSRLENIHRLEDASQCVGEAVTLLATSLERAGIIRSAPIRPRVVRKLDGPDDLQEQRKSA